MLTFATLVLSIDATDDNPFAMLYPLVVAAASHRRASSTVDRSPRLSISRRGGELAGHRHPDPQRPGVVSRREPPAPGRGPLAGLPPACEDVPPQGRRGRLVPLPPRADAGPRGRRDEPERQGRSRPVHLGLARPLGLDPLCAPSRVTPDEGRPDGFLVGDEGGPLRTLPRSPRLALRLLDGEGRRDHAGIGRAHLPRDAQAVFDGIIAEHGGHRQAPHRIRR